MLAENYKRGFTEEKLKTVHEPRIKYDEGGFYIMTISENVKLYIEDFYSFLETLDTYRQTVDKSSTLIFSTDSDYLQYLKKIR